MATKHAEVAGAGLAGLMAATRLAQSGGGDPARAQQGTADVRRRYLALGERAAHVEAAGDSIGHARAQRSRNGGSRSERTRADTRPILPTTGCCCRPRRPVPSADRASRGVRRADRDTRRWRPRRREGVLDLEGGERRAASGGRRRRCLLAIAGIDLCTPRWTYGSEAGIRMMIDRTRATPIT